MSLETPVKIREFQRKLYRKAKQEPSYRFYLLYDKICREDILRHAYQLAKANAGAPGVDGESFLAIEQQGSDEWLAALRQELIEERYRPQAVRRVMIPKPNGGERPLGIPTIRDRVVQTAAKLVVEPIFEADLEPNAYGYRPRRSAQDAVRKVHELLVQGYTDVLDADLSKYFDTIPHAELMQCVARRISDRRVLHLIKMWLTAAVMQQDDRGNWQNLGRNRQGTPQGGVISPLLANLYLNRFLKYFRLQGKSKIWRAEIVSYADDFVILTQRRPAMGGPTGTSLDPADDDAPRTYPQREQNQRPRRLARGLRLSRLYVRSPLLVENRTSLYRRPPLEEKHPTPDSGGL